MTGQLDRIEWKLDQLLQMVRGASQDAPLPEKKYDNETAMVMSKLHGMTMKQHAVLQMLLRGAGNQEVADRFGVSVNTSKVYVRSIAKKLGTHTRTETVVIAMPVMQEMTDTEYAVMARGLPRDWDASYNYERREDDPYWERYTGSRVQSSDEE